MSFLLLGLAILVGLLVPTQIGLNGRLAVILDNPIIAALISFSVGAITFRNNFVCLEQPTCTFLLVSACAQ